MGQRVGRSVPGAVRLTIDSHLGLYSGYLIVKLRLTTGGALSREESLERIRQFSSEFVGAPVPCSWLIYSVSPERLEALEAALSDEERPQLSRVARIDFREQAMRLESLLDALRAKDDVIEFAYAELAVTFELGGTTPFRHSTRQGYLDAAPEGIGARDHWEASDLSLTRLVDIESAWSRAHEDICDQKLVLLNSMSPTCPECVNHGTSVLGVLVAKRNSIGGTGVAYEVPSVGLVSTWNPVDRSDENVANAVIAAVDRWASDMEANVVLLEVQRDDPFTPTEVDWCDWHAIRCAVAHGMAVIECAGNGQTRINWQPPQAPSSQGMMGARNNGTIELKDSGATMVGAGKHFTFYDPETNTGLHSRSESSNFGTRIDCYAWGDSIYTTGIADEPKSPGVPLKKSYRSDFGGTSGAAAIIAGAALLIQGVAWRRKQIVLPPGDLRILLKNYGTGQRNPATGPIGAMPDLKQVLGHI